MKYFVGLRKFIVTILFMLIMVFFRINELIDGQQFVDTFEVIVGAFLATNIGEHVINWMKQQNN